MGLGDQIHRATASVLDRMPGYLDRGWITGALARNSQDESCHPDDPDACCYCLNGAALAAAGMFVPDDVFIGTVEDRAAMALVAIRTHLGECTVIWNDKYCIGQQHVQGVVRDAHRRWLNRDPILVSAVHTAALDGTLTGLAGIDDDLPF